MRRREGRNRYGTERLTLTFTIHGSGGRVVERALAHASAFLAECDGRPGADVPGENALVWVCHDYLRYFEDREHATPDELRAVLDREASAQPTALARRGRRALDLG